MPEEKNRLDECYEAFSTINSRNYKEEEWVLLIGNEAVFHHTDEETVLDYAEKHFPDQLPCLVKVPSKHPLTT